MSGDQPEQHTESAQPAPPAGDRWGDPITPIRQDKLKALADQQREWAAAPDHQGRRSYFLGVPLTGADVFWLAAYALTGPKGDVAEGDVAAAQERLRTARHRGEDIDLSGLHLEGADLQLAHLEGAHLHAAHLEGAVLIEAHLEGASLGEAHLEGAVLIEVHLEGAFLGAAHLEGASLSAAHLEGAVLHAAYLERAFLHAAHLEGAVVWQAHLERADLHQAHLEGASLLRAYLETLYVNTVTGAG